MLNHAPAFRRASGPLPFTATVALSRRLLTAFVLAASGLSPAVAGAELVVVTTSPALHTTAATTSSVSIEFDQAVDQASVNDDTFRAFGHWSGPARGTFSFSNGDKTVTLTPDEPFSAGETVFVNLSHDLEAVDTTNLRSAGYAFQFRTAVVATAGVFRQIDSFSNRTSGQTRLYGATAADLDDDGYLDLATVNEVSADVRVFMNRGDGSGLYESMLAPVPVGVEASPNEPADFDNDGKVDLCLSATASGVVNVLLGAGDGTFSSTQTIPVGPEPHGIAPIDVDGDADLDIVNSNSGLNALTLMINDGNGVFGAPTTIEGGVNGEYALAASDMNADGITDLVVGGRNGEQINVMLGNGDGTFTPAASAQSSGGQTWVIALADIDGDLDLDVTAANNGSGTVGVLKSNGDGTFAAPTVLVIGSHLPSVKMGDLDGDGDNDMVISSYGGGFWRVMENDGSGAFSLMQQVTAVNSPSCAVLLDFDNDGDLDLSLFDELDDTVTLMENSPETLCTAAPSICRGPIAAGKSKLSLSKFDAEDQDLSWSWSNGEATDIVEFGTPTVAEDYELCIYEDGALVRGLRLPGGQTCPNKACWKQSSKGFSYKDGEKTPDGLSKGKMLAGLEGKSKIGFKGTGVRLDLPDFGAFDGTVDVQLQRLTDPVCWGATYSPPFLSQSGTSLRASSDAP